jgi:hypothetical protein
LPDRQLPCKLCVNLSALCVKNFRKGSFPKQKGSFPKQKGRFPKGKGRFPKGKGSFPKGKGSFPKGKGSFPKRKGRFPKQKAASRKKKDNRLSHYLIRYYGSRIITFVQFVIRYCNHVTNSNIVGCRQ